MGVIAVQFGYLPFQYPENLLCKIIWRGTLLHYCRSVLECLFLGLFIVMELLQLDTHGFCEPFSASRMVSGEQLCVISAHTFALGLNLAHL
jgi:hypothetical protein